MSDQMSAGDARRSELIQVLTEARDQGLGRLEELAVREAERRRLDSGSLLSYWRQHIHYTLGEAELAGLEKFAQLAARYDLVGGPRAVQVAEM